MKVNGESIYGTRPSPLYFPDITWRATVKPGKLYLHILNWPGTKLRFEGLESKVNKAYFLANKAAVPYAERGRDWSSTCRRSPWIRSTPCWCSRSPTSKPEGGRWIPRRPIAAAAGPVRLDRAAARRRDPLRLGHAERHPLQELRARIERARVVSLQEPGRPYEVEITYSCDDAQPAASSASPPNGAAARGRQSSKAWWKGPAASSSPRKWPAKSQCDPKRTRSASPWRTMTNRPPCTSVKSRSSGRTDAAAPRPAAYRMGRGGAVSTGHQQVEQNRTSTVHLYQPKLARKAAAEFRGDRKSHRRHDHYQAGLKVHAELDTGAYPAGTKVADQELAEVIFVATSSTATGTTRSILTRPRINAVHLKNRSRPAAILGHTPTAEMRT